MELFYVVKIELVSWKCLSNKYLLIAERLCKLLEADFQVKAINERPMEFS